MHFRLLFVLSVFFLFDCRVSAQTITTIAGNGTFGFSGDGGVATLAQLADVFGVAADNAGNVYIADTYNNVIRKVNSAGIISTFAGNRSLGYSGDGGPATSAKLYHPGVLSLNNSGDLYFTDQNGDVIRKINSAGIITSITGNLPQGYSGDGGPLALARFAAITGITDDNAGNLYIVDAGNQAVRKVNALGIISTIAGTGTSGFSGDGGPATSAQLRNPYQVVLDKNGNIYIPDAGNYRIRKINSAGIISTFAGNGIRGYSGDGGPATGASLNFPWFSSIDNLGNFYACDALNLVVRKITPGGIITTYAGNGTYGNGGNGGQSASAQMGDPCQIAVDNLNNLYIVDRSPFNVVKKVNNCSTPTIAQQPSTVSLCNVGNISFSISSTNATSSRWQLNAGTGWNNISDNSIYSGSSTNSLNITGAGTALNNYQYRCVVTNACGSVFSLPDTLTVTSPSTPSITISTTASTICTGTNTTFNAVVQNGGSFPVYVWKKNGIGAGTSAPTYTDNNLNNGDVVSCVLTSNGSCITTHIAQSNPITVTVNPVLTPSLSIAPSANNICFGTPVTFTSTTVNGGNSPSFQWLKNGVAMTTGSSSYNDNTLMNGDIISCVLTSDNACVSSPTSTSNAVVMNISPLVKPAIIVTASKSAVCPNTPVTFTASINDGGSAPVYQWKKNGSNVGSGSGTYIDNNISNADVISCVLFSNSNCLEVSSVESNSINMTVFQNPVVSLNHLTNLCEGSSRQLDAGSFSSYRWNGGSSGKILSINNIGTYYVTVTDNNGCVGSDTVKITSLLPAPKNFLPFDTSICSYGLLNITSPGAYKTYAWNTLATTPAVTISKAGLYWLEVVDANNCKGRDSINVSQRDCMKGFYIPTAFTPNRDGKNDFFRPLLFGNIRKYEFMIYNRFGQAVFHTDEIAKGWDGTLSGTDQDTNTFVWFCSYQLEGEQPESKKGTLVLIR